MNLNIFSNKSLLYFLGGVTLGVVGPKILKSEKFKQLCLVALAKALQMKESAGVVSEEFQEKFADFLAQAQAFGAEVEAEAAKMNAAAAEPAEADPVAEAEVVEPEVVVEPEAPKAKKARKAAPRKTAARKTAARKPRKSSEA